MLARKFRLAVTLRFFGDLARFRQWYDFHALGRVVSFIYLQVENDRF